MREIKFRAWDKLNQVMGDVLQYLPYAGENGTIKIDINAGVAYMSHDFELMQFTGINDTNGKEIWEGDIVTSLGTTFRVEYDGDGFYAVNGEEYASLNSYTGLDNPYDIDDALVIGNIYENPDLIS